MPSDNFFHPKATDNLFLATQKFFMKRTLLPLPPLGVVPQARNRPAEFHDVGWAFEIRSEVITRHAWTADCIFTIAWCTGEFHG